MLESSARTRSSVTVVSQVAAAGEIFQSRAALVSAVEGVLAFAPSAFERGGPVLSPADGPFLDVLDACG